jgi:hypothetical protein
MRFIPAVSDLRRGFLFGRTEKASMVGAKRGQPEENQMVRSLLILSSVNLDNPISPVKRGFLKRLSLWSIGGVVVFTRGSPWRDNMELGRRTDRELPGLLIIR